LFAGIDDVIRVGDVIIVEEATEVVGLSDEREPAEVKLSLNDRDPEIFKVNVIYKNHRRESPYPAE
jgi:uridine phosphorylase